MLSNVETSDRRKEEGAGGGNGKAGARAGRRSTRRRQPVTRSLPETPFPLPVPDVPSFGRCVVDIRDHGAVGDGKALCTAAIASAIAACAEAGGGRVVVPAGTWLTGPIHLRSRINLHLSAGATIVFVPDPAAYLPPVLVRWGGMECLNYSPLIYARDCDSIGVTGTGTLRGQGAGWWSWEAEERAALSALYQMVLDGRPPEQRQLLESPHRLRPQFIAPVNCTNVLLEDFSIAEGGPGRTIHLTYCRSVIVRRLSIEVPDGPGNDGIKIDSSSDVLVEDCTLRTHGNCISLKSGLNEDGWRVARPSERVVVRRIRAKGGDAGLMVGSATSGDVRDVLVHDCQFDQLAVGIRLRAARGRGGVVENVHVRDIQMGRITSDAIRMDLESTQLLSPSPRPPVFRKVRISKVSCLDAETAVRIWGLPDKHFQDIRLEDVTIAAGRGLQCDAVQKIDLVNVNIVPVVGPVLSLNDSQEVLIEGLRHAPQEGVFLALRGRQTRRVRVRGDADQQVRPAIVLGADVPHDALVHE